LQNNTIARKSNRLPLGKMVMRPAGNPAIDAFRQREEQRANPAPTISRGCCRKIEIVVKL
jgi:hypothetical protein